MMKIFKNLDKIFSFSHFIALGFAIFYSVAIDPILKCALHFNCVWLEIVQPSGSLTVSSWSPPK